MNCEKRKSISLLFIFLTEISICENKLPYKILRKQNSMYNSELTDFDLYKKRSPKRFFLYQFRALDSLFYKNLFIAL